MAKTGNALKSIWKQEADHRSDHMHKSFSKDLKLHSKNFKENKVMMMTQ